jgi:hypothetical protein
MRRAKLDLTPAQLALAKAEHESKDLAPLFSDAWRKVSGYFIDECGWTKEYTFADDRGWRFDFAHISTRVAVEVDGGQKLAAINKRTGKPFAVGRHSSDADHWKIAVAVSRGWKVFQFTPTMITRDPSRCVSLVAVAMGFVLGKGSGYESIHD